MTLRLIVDFETSTGEVCCRVERGAAAAAPAADPVELARALTAAASHYLWRAAILNSKDPRRRRAGAHKGNGAL